MLTNDACHICQISGGASKVEQHARIKQNNCKASYLNLEKKNKLNSQIPCRFTFNFMQHAQCIHALKQCVGVIQ